MALQSLRNLIIRFWREKPLKKNSPLTLFLKWKLYGDPYLMRKNLLPNMAYTYINEIYHNFASIWIQIITCMVECGNQLVVTVVIVVTVVTDFSPGTRDSRNACHWLIPIRWPHRDQLSVQRNLTRGWELKPNKQILGNQYYNLKATKNIDEPNANKKLSIYTAKTKMS